MRWRAPGCKVVGVVSASLLTISLGVVAGVFVAGPASASSPPTTTTTGTGPGALPPGSDPNSPAARYFVLNGTADAASDHEILGSSAFPNFSKGAVDNYYSMAHTHVDNSPFAQGTASPADTGPVGQTAAAGNFQQPQYADARWPGGSGKATYGNQGGPYAVADASDYKATAESSAASSGLSGPTGSTEMATPKGFDGKLRKALATWKGKWQGRLGLPSPTSPVKTPSAPVVTPSAPVTPPTAPVTTPTVTVGGLTTVPSVTVPAPSVPSATAPRTAAPSRSLSSSSSEPKDGASLLESSTRSVVDPTSGDLVTSGESRLKRLSIGGGQIVIEGIHVTASITNDGTPTYKVAVSVAAAKIGDVPVTIDEDGVHVAGQGGALPYKQASDALNTALKQAGIQLFLVEPEIETGGSCDQTGNSPAPGPGAPTGTTTTSTTTTTKGNDRPDAGAPMGGSCDQTGTTGSTGSCDQPDTTTTTSTTPGLPTGTSTTTTSSNPKGTTTTTSTNERPGTSSCDRPGMTTTPTSSCAPTGKTRATTTTSGQPGAATTTSSSDPTGPGGAGADSGELTVKATGVHVVFTQPVSQSGVPAQFAEHILGEVSLNSLAVPAGPVPKLDLSSLSSSSSSCLNGAGKKKTKGGAVKIGGGSPAGGSPASGSSSSSSSPSSLSGVAAGSSQQAAGWSGGGSQPTASSAGSGLQAAPTGLASVLKKPMWLLGAYLLWQALVIATGASLWHWRRGGGAP